MCGSMGTTQAVQAQSENSRVCSAPVPPQQLEKDTKELPADTDSSGMQEASAQAH